MKNYDLFNAIIDSYYNGQTGQGKEQIKRYGKKAFLFDLINHYELNDYMKVCIIQRFITGR